MTVVPQQLELIYNLVRLCVFVSVLTAATAAHAGSVTIAASVFPDRPLSDQTSWSWSGPEEINPPTLIGVYTTLAVMAFGCEWFGMNPNFSQEEKREVTAEMLCADWMRESDNRRASG